MKATLEPVLDVLGMPGTRFMVPVFQRVYSWTERQCGQLLDDALEAGATGMPHFMGTMIYLPEGPGAQGADPGEGSHAPSAKARASLIDGQQRLTTLSLLLLALKERLARGSATERAAAASIDEEYLRVGAATKLALAEADAITFEALVLGSDAPGEGRGEPSDDEPSRFLVDNLAFFARRLEEDGIDAMRMLAALRRLVVVAVELDEQDAAQQVFESLNAKGKPLTTADLLRNTLLLRHGAREQERLFAMHWAPLDAAFAAFAPEEDVYLDAALHAWLATAAPDIEIAQRSDLYQAFKGYLARVEDGSLEDMLRSISRACLAFAAEPGSHDAREHLDWAIGKQEGLVSERKLFGD